MPDSFDAYLTQCVSPEVTSRFLAKVVASLPDVESSTTLRTIVGAVLDPSARNGWGHAGIVYAVAGDDPLGMWRRAVVMSGRCADPVATDEVLIGERAAQVLGVTVGDVIDLASWRLAL